jgi:glycosyltransferase involved in cell wall biosynthesis
MDLSIIMPAYNEAATVLNAADRALDVEMPVTARELIIVDDGSSDGTADALRLRSWPDDVQVLIQAPNRGKGAAVRAGLAAARGSTIATLDADLEYDPADLAKMIPFLDDDHTDAVFGSRMWQAHSAYGYWYVVGNRVINTTANVLYNAWLSDICAGLKVLSADLMRSLSLREEGFAIEAEITGRLLRRRARIYEVPISYRARAREEGKKIQPSDGLRIMRTLFECRLRPT